MPVIRYLTGSNALFSDGHRSLEPPAGPAQSIFRSLEFLPSNLRRPDPKRFAALHGELQAALKKLRGIQKGVANGKNTLKELEAAANKAYALEWEANHFRRSRGADPEIRLARLRFTIAYLNLEGVVDGLWDGTRTLKDAETALRAVHKTLNAGTRDLTKAKREEANYERQISSQMAILRKEMDKWRKKTESEALRSSKAAAARNKRVAGLSGTRKISDQQRSIELKRAVVAAQQELGVARKRATWLEHRAVKGTASLKQAEAALIAESLAFRKFMDATRGIEVAWRVASNLRQAKDHLAQLELRKQAAERAKQERQKRLRLRESLVVEDVKRLKSLGIK